LRPQPWKQAPRLPRWEAAAKSRANRGLNAPTYLVFFQLAGGDPQALMGPLADMLAAISMGAVYMGALTYIGNAPNFMIYAIAEERGVKMPSFFGYMAWAGAVLVPVFIILTLVPIR
jgi:Na+/H+ antiporter NhaD/arsenite permease-like protein